MEEYLVQGTDGVAMSPVPPKLSTLGLMRH